MTLQDCLERAIANNPEIRVLDQETEMLDMERKSIRGRFLPVVQTDAKSWLGRRVPDEFRPVLFAGNVR